MILFSYKKKLLNNTLIIGHKIICKALLAYLEDASHKID